MRGTDTHRVESVTFSAGKVSLNEAQPFSVKCGFGQIALCHNGNLPDASEVRFRLEQEGAIFSSTSDTEVVLHRIARSRAVNLMDAIIDALRHDDGAFSMLFATPPAISATLHPAPSTKASSTHT